MFTAVLQLRGIAPKFPTIARGSSSVPPERPVSLKQSRGFFAERLSTTGKFLFRSRPIVAFTNSPVRSCAVLRKRVLHLARYADLRAILCREYSRVEIRYRVSCPKSIRYARTVSLLRILRRSVVFAAPRTTRTANPANVSQDSQRLDPALNSSIYF